MIVCHEDNKLIMSKAKLFKTKDVITSQLVKTRHYLLHCHILPNKFEGGGGGGGAGPSPII